MPRSTSLFGSLLLAAVMAAPALVDAGGVRFLEKEDTPETASALAVTADGKHLYVTGGNATALSVHPLDGAGGIGASIQEVAIDDATSIAVSGDKAHVYVTVRGGPGNQDGSLLVFRRETSQVSLDFGKLTQIQAVVDADLPVSDSMRKPQAVVVSPRVNPGDDRHVYVVNAKSKSIVAFTRETNTGSANYGKLTFLEVQQQTPGGCDTLVDVCGLNNARYLAFSPDGKSLYAAGNKGDTKAGTVAVFARNTDLSPDDGKLTFKQAVRNLENGVTSLHHPSAIAVDADGQNVYVTSPGGKAIHVFARDSGTGMLTVVEFHKDGGVTKGLKGASGVAVDASGAYVYVTGAADNALTVFRRSDATGKLTPVETQFNSDKPAAPLHDLINPQDAVVDPVDGKHLYVASSALRVLSFTIDTCGDGKRGSDEQCDDGDTISGNGCSNVCRIERCGALPADNCTTVHTTIPESAALTIKNDPADADTKDQLQWKWQQGTVTAGTFGDPRDTATYVLCVYDGSGAMQPVMSIVAPHGAADDCKNGDHCWKTSPGPSTKTPHVSVGAVTKFLYGDRSYTPDGLQQVKLQTGNGNASIQVKGKGINLQPPPFPAGGIDLPVTVMLKNTENHECWQAQYDASVPGRIIQRDGTAFKAKSN